ncbi:unnamed protein product, partial [Auanema sp. JU1783]
STIPELQPANTFPGTTHCVESCGGPGCGCFYPSSGCLYYRTYLKPNSEILYEVIECDIWNPSTRIQLTLTTGSNITSYNLTLRDDTIVTHDIFSLQITGLTTPVIPLMQQRFIRSAPSTAILPTHTQLQCPNMTAAAQLQNCTATPDCSCLPAEDAIKCDCRDDGTARVFNDIHHTLPLISPTYSLQSLHDDIIMKIRRNTLAEILLTIKGTFNTSSTFHTFFTFTNTSCGIPDTTITGCYNCQQGAQTNIVCTSSQTTLAATQCGDTAFMVHCDPTGLSNSIRLSALTATPNLNCSFSCGESTKNFNITGVLYYVNNIYTLQQ